MRRSVAAVAAAVVILGGATEAGAGGGHVLAPQAHPHGYSLTDMTEALAVFTTVGNDPAFYPDTPFQILYVDPSTLEANADGDGLLFTGTNTFTVARSTMFFVPVWNANDSPPVSGIFPTTHAQAVPYFFDPSQVGGQGFAIIVDGQATPLGPEYLAGPVTVPLPDGGNHMMTIGAFLTPLSVGTHTVRIVGGLYGDLVAESYGISHLAQDLTYTVTVLK